MDMQDLLARCRPGGRKAPLVSVLRLYGVIGGGAGLRRGLSLAALAGAIEAAFKPKGLAAVALAINSPGGSPVQSSLIAGRIRQWADEKKVPVFAFTEDVAASGGYWLALAADEIFVDPASLLGSIGVVSGGFGFPALLERLGVERRLYTQGANKAMLDPFRPENPGDVERLKALQADLHAEFKDTVRRRRAGRLKAEEAELFEGDIWAGRRAVALGLADGVGDLRSVLRGRFGERVRLRVVGPRESWLRRRLGLRSSSAIPSSLAESAIDAIEERLAWARWGL